MRDIVEPFSLSSVEILGGIRSFSVNTPAKLSFALFIETGLPQGDPRFETLKTWLGYGEPGQRRVVLTIPASLAKEKLGASIRSEFPPILYPEDEKAMHDFQNGHWGDDGQKLVDWIKSSYQSLLLPALSLLTDTCRHLELESGASGIIVRAVSP